MAREESKTLPPLPSALLVIGLGLAGLYYGSCSLGGSSLSASALSAGSCAAHSRADGQVHFKETGPDNEDDDRKREATLSVTVSTEFSPAGGGATRTLSDYRTFSSRAELAGTFTGPSQTELDQRARDYVEKQASLWASHHPTGSCWAADGLDGWFRSQEEAEAAVSSAAMQQKALLLFQLGGGGAALLFGLVKLYEAVTKPEPAAKRD